MKLTIISDTHGKHKHITSDLTGGDLLLHAGDLSSMGYEHEIREFASWYDKLDNYGHKVFIAGNHDWGFQNNVEKVKGLLTGYKTIEYIQDELITIQDGDGPEVKIWGSPWQPEFYNWAFNLPRNGEELKAVWDMIPEDIDILITHGPVYGILDDTITGYRAGCEDLYNRIMEIKPKLHVCGHIHWGYGERQHNGTTFINASSLGERYTYDNKPIVLDYDEEL